MSNQEIGIISELLLGITNPDRNIHTMSVNKLLELNSKNFDLFLFYLLDIIEKNSKPINEKQKLLKITSLIISRKIIENADYNILKKKNKDLKIKAKILTILNNEMYIKDNLKVCDLITEILQKIFEDKGAWPEIINLILNIFNYDPNQGDQFSLQIISLLYIIKGGINFLYKKIAINLNKFVTYLEKIFNSSNIDIKAKILAGELIYEMISFANGSELKKIKILIKYILSSLYENFQLFKQNNKNEKDIKSFLKICIDIESLIPDLLEKNFQDIFNLGKEIILNQKFEDEKIREMGFELIISLIEDKSSLVIYGQNRVTILNEFIELILNYSLEFDKNIIFNSYENYFDNSNQNIDNYIEDEIKFSISIFERLFESIKIEYINDMFKLIVEKYIQKSWKYQYIILFFISTYCNYNKDISFVKQFFDIIINLSCFNENKVRLASIYTINNFIKIYDTYFLNENISKILPLIIHLLQNENDLKCKFQILYCLKNIIHYNKSPELNNYIENIYDLLMNLFGGENNNALLRKLIILNILELNNKKNEDEKIKFILDKIDINILFNYFINLYNNKSDMNLYGVLLEAIVLIGTSSIEKLSKIKEDILIYIIKIIKEFGNKENNKLISLCEIIKSFCQILPIIIKNNENINLLYELLNINISLIKSKNIMSLNILSDIDFEITNYINDLNNESNINYENLYNTQTEDFSSLLSLLLCILNSIINKKCITSQNIIDIENEIILLINYKQNKNIRNKSSKIMVKLISFMNNEQKRMKILSYIHVLINSIEKEIDGSTAKHLFERIKDIIDGFNEEFLAKNEVDNIFNKLYIFMDNLKKKKMQYIEKQNNHKEKFIKNKLIINKEENSDYEYINELIIKEINIIEDILIEIVDIIGKLLKTHKDKCDYIIEQIISKIIPSLVNSNNKSEIKLAIYLSDDLIEYISQEKLGDKVWEYLYQIITQFILYEDYQTIQAAAYGIGIFSKNTKNNFIKYGNGLIGNLYKSLSNCLIVKNNINSEKNEEFYMAHNNIIAALGKVIKYQFNSSIVQDNINGMIEKWIMNLPIKNDESEQEEQHEWMINLFIYKRDIFPIQCYPHFFEAITEIYLSRYSNKKIDTQIELIFINYVKNEKQLRNILAYMFENASNEVKDKLNILASKNLNF